MTILYVVAGKSHTSLEAAIDDRAGLLDDGYNVDIERYVLDGNDNVVFALTDDEEEFQADIDANYTTTVWSPCVTAIGTDHDGVEFD